MNNNRDSWTVFLPDTPQGLNDLATDLAERFCEGDQQVRSLVESILPDHHSSPLAEDEAHQVTAAAYGVESWERMELACEMIAALRNHDPNTVLRLIRQHPHLLNEHAAGIDNNWGPPMSYAANLGLTELVMELAELGAEDIQHALTRATLRGQIETADALLLHGAKIERGMVMGCCETLNVNGLKFLVSHGAELCDSDGNRDAPLALLLQTYWRNPERKHACLEFFDHQGIALPDSPVMAFHRGRIDLLQKHLDAQPDLISRRFTLREIYPADAGCGDDPTNGLHGTPLDGTTLLHMAADFDEVRIAEWLLKNGADPNARAQADADGFGDHTPLFNTVVSMSAACSATAGEDMSRLLLQHHAAPSLRATLRKALKYAADETMHEFRNVTPEEYAMKFQAPGFVSQTALKAIRDARSV